MFAGSLTHSHFSRRVEARRGLFFVEPGFIFRVKDPLHGIPAINQVSISLTVLPSRASSLVEAALIATPRPGRKTAPAGGRRQGEAAESSAMNEPWLLETMRKLVEEFRRKGSMGELMFPAYVSSS